MSEWLRGRIRFDRNELSGAFGDIGTDFPLLVGMILVAGLDVTSSLVLFGAMQIFTGLFYGIPMPAEPLKAMAVIVITQKLSGNVLFGGGLAIGILMLLLTVTGLIDWLARAVPKIVVRGIQLGLGLQLAQLALKDYIPADKNPGYVLAGIAFALTIALLGNRRFPPALFVILLGMVYGFLFKIHAGDLVHSFGFTLPHFHTPSRQDILTGLVVLAIPQLPLSLGNSVLATRQVAEDFYPDRKFSIRQISTTYSLMNLVNPFFGGVPTCHGSGGMVGHYTFGARTGGSVVIYGSMYLALGLFLSRGFSTAIELFPKPILGVILLFEGINLMGLIRDQVAAKADFLLVILIGLMCVGLPYGYVIGLSVGTALAYLSRLGLTGLGK
ncbi:MAG TPA: putative sulfate/molybdate transporter [Candidatus Limnocylindria bacterium]|nr:putative sulfate/molybdate transporter [Candidatus Limnocylindria bacterium]